MIKYLQRPWVVLIPHLECLDEDDDDVLEALSKVLRLARHAVLGFVVICTGTWEWWRSMGRGSMFSMHYEGPTDEARLVCAYLQEDVVRLDHPAHH